MTTIGVVRSFGGRLLLAALVVVAIGFGVWRTARPKVVPVVLAVVDRGRVERTVANTRAGTVQACRRAKLAPPSGGQIVSLPVHEGDRVESRIGMPRVMVLHDIQRYHRHLELRNDNTCAKSFSLS
jgi:multidrug efflux pump subunit AcrA (membrane-fusion protein)